MDDKAINSKKGHKKPWDWIFLLCQYPRSRVPLFILSYCSWSRGRSPGDGYTTALGEDRQRRMELHGHPNEANTSQAKGHSMAVHGDGIAQTKGVKLVDAAYHVGHLLS